MTDNVKDVRLESLRAFVSFLKNDIFKNHSHILKHTGIYTVDTAWFDFSNLSSDTLDCEPNRIYVGVLLNHERNSRLYAIPSTLILRDFIDNLNFTPLLTKEEDNLIAHTAHADWAKCLRVCGIHVLDQIYDSNKITFTISHREAIETDDYQIIKKNDCSVYEIPVRYSSNITTIRAIEHDLDYIAINSVIEYQKLLTGLQKKTGNDIFKETSI